jgi:hypothetical protein
MSLEAMEQSGVWQPYGDSRLDLVASLSRKICHAQYATAQRQRPVIYNWHTAGRCGMIGQIPTRKDGLMANRRSWSRRVT